MASIGNALGSAVSGLLAAQQRVVGAADNIANARSRSSADPATAAEGDYFANRTLNSSNAQGGVTATTTLANPASVQIYDPDAQNADENGFTFIPNVNIERELVETINAENEFAANAAVIRIADELADEAIDILT
jgi:flagellar basal body rod protein FlgC